MCLYDLITKKQNLHVMYVRTGRCEASHANFFGGASHRIFAPIISVICSDSIHYQPESNHIFTQLLTLALDLDLAIMVRFGAAASALQKAAASYSSKKIGTVTCQCAAARLTSTSSPSTSWKNPPRRQLSIESPSLQDRGIMDSNDLLQFNTLHELQQNSSEAFGSNPLFGTHNGKEEGGEFEWMTYEEWGRKVDACRTVLKDTCGEFVCFGALLE